MSAFLALSVLLLSLDFTLLPSYDPSVVYPPSGTALCPPGLLLFRGDIDQAKPILSNMGVSFSRIPVQRPDSTTELILASLPLDAHSSVNFQYGGDPYRYSAAGREDCIPTDFPRLLVHDKEGAGEPHEWGTLESPSGGHLLFQARGVLPTPDETEYSIFVSGSHFDPRGQFLDLFSLHEVNALFPEGFQVAFATHDGRLSRYRELVLADSPLLCPQVDAETARYVPGFCPAAVTPQALGEGERQTRTAILILLVICALVSIGFCRNKFGASPPG